MKKNFLTTMTGLLITISSFAYSGGNGSELFPYLISSKADMQELATNVNGGQTYSGNYFRLTRDLTGRNDTVTTVVGKDGNSTSCFRGSFDGDGHEIAVKIISTTDYTGLFGYMINATIKNLRVSGSVSGGQHVGGICGFLSPSNTITDCYNTAKISSSSSIAFAGGICGWIGSSNNKITKCYNGGNIIINSIGTAAAGGICGSMNSSNYNNLIENCYNTGAISATTTNSTTNYFAYAGGICGDAVSNNNTIRNCYSIKNVSSDKAGTAAPYSGGICANSGTVQNCFVDNSRISNKNDAPRASIGRIGGANGAYTNCYSEGMSVTLNLNAISSSNANSKDGKDCLTANLQNQSWLETNLLWDFNGVWTITAGNYPTLKSGNDPVEYTITATASPVAGGNVSGSGTFDQGTEVTLIATPNNGYAFSGWSTSTVGNTYLSTNPAYTFTAAENLTLYARFTAIPRVIISAAATPAEGGRVSGNTGEVPANTLIELQATENLNYTFKYWIEIVSDDPDYSFIATENRTLLAVFESNESTRAFTVQPRSSIIAYSDYFNIVLENVNNLNIAVYTSAGQLVAQTRSASSTIKIPVPQAGLYLVNAGSEILKVIVE